LSSPSPLTTWHSLYQALCTTRERRLEELRAEWKAKSRKARTPREVSMKIAADLPALTIFNFLWRLRKRSDYRDADVFVEGIWSARQAIEYHSSLATLVAGTVTALNTVAAAYVGPSVLQEAAKAFLRRPEVYDAVRPRVVALTS
jgi:hypothetical protein